MKWSISLHNTIRRCQKQFFFQYLMASHSAKDSLRKEAHVLRQLQTLTMWRGGLVHDALHLFFVPTLSSRNIIPEKEIISNTLHLADIRYAFSKDRKYRSGEAKSHVGEQFCALFEHEYGQEISSDAIPKIKEEIAKCYSNLYKNDQMISTLNRGNWYGSELNLPFQLNGSTISGKLDLVMFSGNDMFIVDWKIGSSESSDYALQLQVYAMAALSKWNKPLGNLHLIEYNLLTNEVTNHSSTVEKIQNAEDFIYRSLLDLHALTGNKPYSEQDFHDYSCANSSETCRYCKFLSLCLRMLHD